MGVASNVNTDIVMVLNVVIAIAYLLSLISKLKINLNYTNLVQLWLVVTFQ